MRSMSRVPITSGRSVSHTEINPVYTGIIILLTSVFVLMSTSVYAQLGATYIEVGRVVSYHPFWGLVVIGIIIVISGIWDLITLRDNTIAPAGLVDGLEALIKKQQYEKILSICQADKSMVSEAIKSGMALVGDDVEKRMNAIRETTGKAIIKLDNKPVKFIFMGVVVLLTGLIGLTTSLIAYFEIAKTIESPSYADMAKGYSESLIPVAESLFVFLLPVLFYFPIRTKAKYRSFELRSASERIISALKHKSANE